ncbi:MAG: helix-turn-helix transcriptional regulator [Prevotella sp.]|jgi:AraC-like DNA-binding protein|nr:helix-turn-helix transcriptional regulator [Prevotella sp.]
MKSIPQYYFHKTKYGEELLIDIVKLKDIQKYIHKDPVHTLSYFDITFIKSTATFSIDNKCYELQTNDVIFSKPGQVRAWETESSNLDGLALIFEEEFLLSFFNDSRFIQNLSYFSAERETPVINISEIKQRTDYLLQNITAEINNYESKDKHILRALLYEILMLLDREYRKQNTNRKGTEKITNRHVNSFIELVNKDFKQHHDTGYYADKLCITPNYLNEIVKKATSVNAKLYIQNKILSEAKRLLAYTSLSISEIAENLNFDSSSYFIRSFRRHTGYTPLQYRNSTKR